MGGGLACGELERVAGRAARAVRGAPHHGPRARGQVLQDLGDAALPVGEDEVDGEGDVLHPEGAGGGLGVEKEHPAARLKTVPALEPPDLLGERAGDLHPQGDLGPTRRGVEDAKQPLTGRLSPKSRHRRGGEAEARHENEAPPRAGPKERAPMSHPAPSSGTATC